MVMRVHTIEAMREARVDKKKHDDDDEDDEAPRGLLSGISVNNPNGQNKHNKQVKLKNMNDLPDLNPEEGLSRREREALEAERKRAEYQRLHLAGKTDQAKEEMKRLERDITLIDLPFDRASSLMAGLYKRRVMGKSGESPTKGTIWQYELPD